jgi:hypothetical protein
VLANTTCQGVGDDDEDGAGTGEPPGYGAAFGQCSVVFQGDDPPVGGSCAGRGGGSMTVSFVEQASVGYRITASSPKGGCLNFTGPSVSIFRCNLADTASSNVRVTLAP